MSAVFKASRPAEVHPGEAVESHHSRRFVKEPALETLRRWEAAGGHWQILSRSPSGLVVALLRCDGGEEVDRFTSTDPALAAYIGDRETSQP